MKTANVKTAPTPSARPYPSRVIQTTGQLEHWNAGGDIYTFHELQSAAVRQRAGQASAEDEVQLSLVRLEVIADLLRSHDTDVEDAARVESEIATHGMQKAVEFYGALGQLGHYERLGVRFEVGRGQHGRARGSTPTRQRGSRRSSSRSGTPPPDSDPDESDPAKGRDLNGLIACKSCGEFKCKPKKEATCAKCRQDKRRRRLRLVREVGTDARLKSIQELAGEINGLAEKRQQARQAHLDVGLLADFDAKLDTLYAVKRKAMIEAGYSLEGFRGRSASVVSIQSRPRVTKAPVAA